MDSTQVQMARLRSEAAKLKEGLKDTEAALAAKDVEAGPLLPTTQRRCALSYVTYMPCPLLRPSL